MDPQIFASETLCLLMFAGTCLLLIAGFPVAFTLGGAALLFAGIGAAAGHFDPTILSAIPQRIFGIMTNDVLVAVPLFVFMGVMLERSRIAEELLDTMGRLFGRINGGLGISVSLVGALLAASTGIVGATVVTMGLMSLPIMLRRNYDPALACGSICAAGTLGQIIPPSIVLVLLGDQISTAYQDAQLRQSIFSPDAISVGDLFAGGLLPGLLLVAMYIAYQAVYAWMRPRHSPAIPAQERDSDASLRRAVLRSLLPPVVLIVSVLGSILAGIATPTEAASVGAVGATLLGAYRLGEIPVRRGVVSAICRIDPRGRSILGAGLAIVAMLVVTAFFDLRLQRAEIPPADMAAIVVCILLALLASAGLVLSFARVLATGILTTVMRSTLEVASMVFVILIGAALFSLTFRGLGGDRLVESFLTDLPGGTVGAIVVVMLAIFLLGFFLDFLEIIFIVVPIVGPVLLQMEFAPGQPVDPVWLGIMIALNLQTSFLTPPFGFALFYLRGVAPPEVTTMQIYRGVVPFVTMQLFMLVILWFAPGLATWLPEAIFG